MKNLKLFLTVVFLVSVSGSAFAQDTLYYEYFTDGALNNVWFTPWDGGDNMEVDLFGGEWVGLIRNASSGGGVGTTLCGELSMTDYTIEADVYTTVGVGTASYNGICARWDTVGGNRYYYLRTDFDADQRLQLRKFPGLSGFGDDIHIWTGAQIPGGVPTTNSWHNMAIKVESNQLWAYWDGVELSGSPFTDNDYDQGFFGIYIFNMMNPNTQTYCDSIIVIGDAAPQPFDFSPQSADILDQNMEPLTIRPAENQTVYFKLVWDAFSGLTTSPAFDVVLNLDGNEIYRENYTGVEPNSSHEVTSNSWTATLGQHIYEWVLDEGNTVPESNEDNNTLEEYFLVLSQNAFDFQADSSEVADEDTVILTENPMDTEEIRFILYWSVPMGVGASGAFNIDMSLRAMMGGDTIPLYTQLIPTALPNQNYTSVTGTWTAEEGFWLYWWNIDADSWIEEFDETNNYLMNGVEVGPYVSVPWGDELALTPNSTRFTAVFPTPFNDAVKLQYEVARMGNVKISVFDVTGREVTILYDGYSAPGVNDIIWSAKDISSGTYFAVLTDGVNQSVQRLLYIK